jgi:hypothetical protein
MGLGLSIPLAPFDKLRAFSSIEAGDLFVRRKKINEKSNAKDMAQN